MSLRQLFRPVYGESVAVSPRRWWSRRQRQAANIAAVVIDNRAQEIGQMVVDAVVYGAVYVDSSGRRVDPTTVVDEQKLRAYSGARGWTPENGDEL